MKFNRGEPFVGVEPPAEEVKNPMPSKEALRQIRSCILSLRYINISPNDCPSDLGLPTLCEDVRPGRCQRCWDNAVLHLNDREQIIAQESFTILSRFKTIFHSCPSMFHPSLRDMSGEKPFCDLEGAYKCTNGWLNAIKGALKND